ncbi:MAG: polysaccharide export protein EpsE [Betaproteobacteria bacterium]|nr:polysaccharide export protein EpsE [Burkholderiaceae bacterium]MCZ8112308.1 polysaccharide export protein EpsE [Rubrivivax sp.]MCZ8173846.1 polysaccharide export protein EpsE [Burkholderiaceae bacterium]
MRRSWVAAALAAASMALALPATAQAPAARAPEVTMPAVPAAEYRLGVGDVLRITVFQNPELTLESRLNEGGVLSFPLIGSVRLGGLSVPEAERLIADSLARGNFLRNPQVTIIVLQVRGNQVNVLGQVGRPGRYPLETADTRLTDMIALAGGVAPGGADVIVVTGTRDGKPFREEVDLPALFTAGGAARDIVLRNGDAVWVDRQPLVYIYGEVQRPGPMRLERGMTLLQALATGGGLTPRGTEKGIRVHRKGGNGEVEVTQPAMTDTLRDGDVVFVRESLF